ncbi:MAG: hypothetical protein O7E49_00740 [Gemmatimonadetes bacterium]|nr:hypothetical protein [Gemmatimonadota bacterium]
MRFTIMAIGGGMLAAAPPPLAAQSVADQIAATEGEVRLSYGTKPGVCGDGRNTVNTGTSTRRDTREWCEPGPARMRLTVRQGRVVDADLAVGGRWNDAGADLDLGRVAAPLAAEALLALAENARDDGGELIMGAVVADSATVWPALLELALAPSVSEDTRDDATLWLGFAAGDALGPDDAGDDDDVRESAIFALSQRPKSEAVPALTRVVEGDHPVHLKKSALFWLGQTDRERAVAVYEEILRGS